MGDVIHDHQHAPHRHRAESLAPLLEQTQEHARDLRAALG
jgi:hypothetical protein